MNPQDSNTTTPSDNPQPNNTPDQEVSVSLGEDTSTAQTDTSASTVTPSLSADNPTAGVTGQTEQPQSPAPTTTGLSNPGSDSAIESGYTAATPGATEAPLSGAVQPVPTAQPEPFAPSPDPAAQPEPTVQPEQTPVPGTLPVAPPHSDKKTLVILAGVAVVLIVAIAVLLFM